MAGVMSNKEVAATAKDGNRWKHLDIKLKGLIEPADDVAILSYEAHATRSNGEPFASTCEHRLCEAGRRLEDDVPPADAAGAGERQGEVVRSFLQGKAQGSPSCRLCADQPGMVSSGARAFSPRSVSVNNVSSKAKALFEFQVGIVDPEPVSVVFRFRMRRARIRCTRADRQGWPPPSGSSLTLGRVIPAAISASGTSMVAATA